MSTTIAPLKFFEYRHAPGTYCLMLGDEHMLGVADVFDAHGRYGNGYGWEGVARSALRSRAPELLERVSFDPEAGMFVAYGTDAEALRTLGSWLSEALRDRTVLAALIEAGEPEWFD